jgi:transposase
MNKTTRYGPEVRAVQVVFEHEGEYPSRWMAIGSMAGKFGCPAETLRKCCVEPGSMKAGGTGDDERS